MYRGLTASRMEAWRTSSERVKGGGATTNNASNLAVSTNEASHEGDAGPRKSIEGGKDRLANISNEKVQGTTT